MGSDALAPMLEGHVGRGRAHEHVDLAEGALEVLVDQLPHALGFQVVGVVIAGGQHVGARHDAALHLGAEALAARALVEVHAGPSGSWQR